MLRRYRTLPRVSSHSRWAASGSTDPPRVAETSDVVSSRERGCRSSRSNWPPFHTSCIPAGIGSPSRTVSTTLAAPRWTIWCKTNIDKSSSRCTSSTPTTTVLPGSADVSDSITARTRWRLSVTRRSGPRGESTQGKRPRRGCANRPTDFASFRSRRRECFAGDSALPHPRGPANDYPRKIRSRYCGLDESHLLRAADQRPRQWHWASQSVSRGDDLLNAGRETPSVARAIVNTLWIKIFYAASSVAVVSSGRSTSLPFSTFAPARTRATRMGHVDRPPA